MSPEVDAFMSKFVDTAHTHKKDCPLYFSMTKNRWCNTVNKFMKEIRSVPHSFNFIQFLCLSNQTSKCRVNYFLRLRYAANVEQEKQMNIKYLSVLHIKHRFDKYWGKVGRIVSNLKSVT